jgi:hypothetical protein
VKRLIFTRVHRIQITLNNYENMTHEKSDWGTLVPRINAENLMKLGFVLE